MTHKISETIYQYEDWNAGLGKKYIVTSGPCIPIKDDNDKVTAYQNAPEKLTEVPRR